MDSKTCGQVPNKKSFELCAGCGICNEYCSVNRDGPGSRSTPQEIAQYLLDLGDVPGDKNQEAPEAGSSEEIPAPFVCTFCSRCTRFCPYQVPFHENIVKAREWIRDNDLVVAPPTLVDMEKSIIKNGNPFENPDEKRDEWIREDFPVLDKADVVYYPGCQVAYNLFGTATSMLKVLKAAGVSATYPGKGDTCCGRPFFFSGKPREQDFAAKRNVEIVIEKGAKILTATCSSCFEAFKQNYPLVMGKLPFEVLHTTELLDRLIKDEKLTFTKERGWKIVYHDPCELGRVAGIYQAPRDVLSALPGVTLLEFPHTRENGLCCGGGGMFGAIDEPKAFDIGTDIIQAAVDLEADVIATACATCNHFLLISRTDYKKKNGLDKKIKILDIAEVVAKFL